jgi:CRISPR/Cas system-associated exonuclease Cas4 (RecB family)
MTEQLALIEERVPEHFSVSELREYMTCPLRWWYRYRAGLRTEKTTSYFALGTAVHSGLGAWYWHYKTSGEREKALELYRQTYLEESAKVDWRLEPAKKDPFEQKTRGEEMLMAAISAGDDWEAESVEETLYAELSHSKFGKLPLPIKMVLDMRTTTNDIVEHKTSDRKWAANREHSDIQASAYIAGVRENYGHDPLLTFNIISNSASGPLVDRRPTRRTQDQLDQLYVHARGLLNAMEKGAIFPNPTAYIHNTCEYRRICDKWESHPQPLPTTRSGLTRMLPSLSEKALPELK